MSTRSQTYVWEIGNLLMGNLSGAKLLSQREVLKCYFYQRQILNLSPKSSKNRALMQCIAFWDSAGFPSDVFQNIGKKFDTLMAKYKKLKILKNRDSDTEIMKRIDFQEQLDSLFDIAHYTTLKKSNYKEKQMFLLHHKKPGRPGNLPADVFISAEDETVFCRPIRKSIDNEHDCHQSKYKVLHIFLLLNVGFELFYFLTKKNTWCAMVFKKGF